MTGPPPSFRDLFAEQFALQQLFWWELFNPYWLFTGGRWPGTIWFWIWGFSAEIMELCTHPVSWFWVGMSVVLWVIAVVGMRFLDKRYVKVEKE